MEEVIGGYKMTDVGYIPVDWEVKTLGEIGLFSKGSGLPKSTPKGNVPAIRYGEIYTDHNDYIRSFKTFIADEAKQYATRLKKGDILFTGSGETKEDIGKSVAFIDDFEAYAGGDVIILSPNIECNPIFMGYVTNSDETRRQKEENAQGDSVVHIQQEKLRDIFIPLPPLSEQTKISEALSAIDSMISETEQAISKKYLIKKGMMQQLLTGKTRLDGFHGEWKIYKLEDICTITKGDVLSTSEYKRGFVPVVAGGLEPAGFHNVANRQGSSITFSASGASAGHVAFYAQPIFATDCLTISESENYDIRFLYNLIKSKQQDIFEMQTGGAQPHVYAKDLYDIEFFLPPALAEQTAIANVLSSMDEEIEGMKAMVEKYRKVKKGMMQELLTGKTRLI